jgi:hypothetical protein
MTEPTRKAPRIDPRDVTAQSAGYHWKNWYVRLPETATLTDLNESPEMWLSVQGGMQTAMRVLDRVTLISHDKTWVVPDAIVAGATATGVSFAKASIKKIDLDPRTERLLDTPEYRVVFVANGFAVERKSDGHMMGGESFSSAQRAATYLDTLYPRAA